MADVFSKSKRSQVMSSIRGKGNRTTEWRLRSRLIQAGIRGWQVGTKEVVGKPDFLFKKKRLALFVDGCFWHGCKRCRNIPIQNHAFWIKKIRSNKKRDSKVTMSLRNKRWRVVRFWEHEITQNPRKCLATVKILLRSKVY
jgi:DNA mismatch endonuclease (patch repair protein)